jgi:hypothetical protein
MDNSTVSALKRIKIKVNEKGLPLNSPVSLQEIEKFEKERNIVLPEGYRRFLLEISNGRIVGPPSLGLLPLGQSDETWSKWTKEKYNNAQNLHLDFPFEESWVWEDEEETEEKCLKMGRIYQGSLYLGTDGCGMDWMLIISGKERGQIWHFTDVGIQPCAPRRDFLSWYEYWFDGHDDWWKDFK